MTNKEKNCARCCHLLGRDCGINYCRDKGCFIKHPRKVKCELFKSKKISKKQKIIQEYLTIDSLGGMINLLQKYDIENILRRLQVLRNMAIMHDESTVDVHFRTEEVEYLCHILEGIDYD